MLSRCSLTLSRCVHLIPQRAKHCVVMGGGLVGKTMSLDMKANGFDVTVCDFDPKVADAVTPYGVAFKKVDFTDEAAVREAVKPADIVIGSGPSHLGLGVVKAALKEKKPVADITFGDDNYFAPSVRQLALEAGVPAIVDCGIAPGQIGMWFGHALRRFEKLENAECYVGGIPVKPRDPWKYFTVFAAKDVVEEYTRPARIKVNEATVVKEAMSDLTPMNVCGYDVEAWNSDGLRSLLDLPIPTMKEMTLRWAGHIPLLVKMRDEGKFKPENIKNVCKELEEAWTVQPGDEDMIIFRFVFEGLREGGVREKEIWEMSDYLVPAKEGKPAATAMARCTGYGCTSCAMAISEGLFTEPGIWGMEHIGQFFEKARQHVVKYNEDRGVSWKLISCEKV